jgi:MFS family permease
MGRALRHRNYRLFFWGQGTSLIGTWLTRVATSWLVYRLTKSALMLGAVSFAGQLPTFLLAPFAGVIVDRVNRHRVLVVTQALAMLQSTALAVLALTNTITVPHVLALSVLQGFINSFDTPARQAFVVEMVESREDLANAIALNSSMVNSARLFGPSIAGVLISLVGEGWCFAIDAFSYLAVLLSLFMMHLVPRVIEKTKAKFSADLGAGFRYVAEFTPLRAILLLLALTSFTGIPYAVLMPVFASQVFKGGPHTLGILMGSAGVGALVGVLWLAARPSVRGLWRVVVISGSAFGLGLVAFSFAKTMWLAIPILAVVGGGMMVQMAASNTLLQTLSDEKMRGRVMSFYTMAFFGMAPFGSLAAGAIGQHYGAPFTVRINGIVTLVAVALFARQLPALRDVIRPIYVKMGILREVADGMSSAAELAPPSEKSN